MPKFSVVIPVYNVEKYLRQCLDSIVNQQADFEVVLVNDGSTDGSLSICQEYADKYPFVRVIDKENGGAVLARKVGVKSSQGEYVVVCDSDDYLDSDLLSRLTEIVDKYNPDVIKLNYCEFSENVKTEKYSKITGKFFDEKSVMEVQSRFIFDSQLNGFNYGVAAYSLWSTVAKRELMEKAQEKVPDKVRLGEDVAVTAPIINKAKSIYFTDTIDYYYRQTPNSMVRALKRDEFTCFETLINHLKDTLPEKNENAIRAYSLHFCVGFSWEMSLTMKRKEFKAWAKQSIPKSLKEFALLAKIDNLKFGDKIRIFLFKHNFYSIFRLLSKLINRK